MTFPVYLNVGPLTLHPHWVFETLAYVVAFVLYRRARSRQTDVVDRSEGGYSFAGPMRQALHWLMTTTAAQTRAAIIVMVPIVCTTEAMVWS